MPLESNGMFGYDLRMIGNIGNTPNIRNGIYEKDFLSTTKHDATRKDEKTFGEFAGLMVQVLDILYWALTRTIIDEAERAKKATEDALRFLVREYERDYVRGTDGLTPSIEQRVLNRRDRLFPSNPFDAAFETIPAYTKLTYSIPMIILAAGIYYNSRN